MSTGRHESRLHIKVHVDPVGAWDEVCEVLETSDDPIWALTLLEDVIYSHALPLLIDDIERRAHESRRFRAWLVSAGDALGGKGGPEMERIFKLQRQFESEFTQAIEGVIPGVIFSMPESRASRDEDSKAPSADERSSTDG